MAYGELIGHRAPALNLLDTNGQPYDLAPGADGIPIALFFYPVSGGYGCTRQACQFRDLATGGGEGAEMLDATRMRIIGLSPDTVERQNKFVNKYQLPFPVLSDLDGVGKRAYHVGRGLLGLYECARTTFIIDGNGIVRAYLNDTLNFSSHCKFVVQWLEYLEAEANHSKSPFPSRTTTPSHSPSPNLHRNTYSARSAPPLSHSPIPPAPSMPPPAPPKTQYQRTNSLPSTINFDMSDSSGSSSESRSGSRSLWDDDPGLFTTKESLSRAKALANLTAEAQSRTTTDFSP